MVNNELLKKIEMFKSLENNQLEKICTCCKSAKYEFGDKLFTENDDASHLWMIIDGTVDLRFELPGGRPTTSANTVSSIKVKDVRAKILGWSCFVHPYKMRLSAYCVSRNCEVIKIEKKDLLNLFQEDPEMGYIVMTYLVKVVGYRFQQFQNVVAENIGQDLLAGW